MRAALAAVMCASCTHSAPPPARVTIAPVPVVRAAPVPPPAPRTTSTSPFEFRTDTLDQALHDYAVSVWGPNGPSAIRWQNGVADVGRYAAVQGTSGFWLRDFGEAGWVTHVERAGARVVVRYTVRDPRSDEDWRKWQHGTLDVTSVAHMILEVWSFSDPKRPRVLFAHEHEAWANCCGSELGPAPPRVEDEVTVTATEVRLRATKPWRATRANWHETPLPGIDPVIAPWDAEKDRTFPIKE